MMSNFSHKFGPLYFDTVSKKRLPCPSWEVEWPDVPEGRSLEVWGVGKTVLRGFDFGRDKSALPVARTFQMPGAKEVLGAPVLQLRYDGGIKKIGQLLDVRMQPEVNGERCIGIKEESDNGSMAASTICNKTESDGTLWLRPGLFEPGSKPVDYAWMEGYCNMQIGARVQVRPFSARGGGLLSGVAVVEINEQSDVCITTLQPGDHSTAAPLIITRPYQHYPCIEGTSTDASLPPIDLHHWDEPTAYG